MYKGERKSLLRKEQVKNAGSAPSVQSGPREIEAAGAKRADPARPQRTWERHVMQILPYDDTVTSDVILKLVASQINPMKAKLGMRSTSNAGVLIFANSAADLERLEA